HTGPPAPPILRAARSGRPHTAQSVRRSEGPSTSHPKRCGAWWPTARELSVRAVAPLCATSVRAEGRTAGALPPAPVPLLPAPVPQDSSGLPPAAPKVLLPRPPNPVPHPRLRREPAVLQAGPLLPAHAAAGPLCLIHLPNALLPGCCSSPCPAPV